jgi:hypothetical protein
MVMPSLCKELSPAQAAALADAWRFADKEGVSIHAEGIDELVESLDRFAEEYDGYPRRKPRIDRSRIETVSIPGVTADEKPPASDDSTE